VDQKRRGLTKVGRVARRQDNPERQWCSRFSIVILMECGAVVPDVPLNSTTTRLRAETPPRKGCSTRDAGDTTVCFWGQRDGIDPMRAANDRDQVSVT